MPRIIVTDHGVTINGKTAKRIHTGSSRRCFVGDGIIVKLNDDHCLFKWMRQSSRELRIWEHIENKDRKYFQKPIAGQIRGNGWIAQRLIHFKRGRKPKWAWQLAERLSDKYGILLDCRERDGSFVSSVNWGITEDGKFKIYDWGY